MKPAPPAGSAVPPTPDDPDRGLRAPLGAARRALAAAACRADEIDCVVVAGDPSEADGAAEAGALAARLGLVGVAALDLRSRCTGFLQALSIGDHLIRLGTAGRVLVVGSDPGAPGAPDGAGAGAAVVAPERQERLGILAAGFHADGRYPQAFASPRPRRDGSVGTAPAPARGFADLEVVAQMYRRVHGALGEALESCGLSPGDVDLLVPSHSCAVVARQLSHEWGIAPERLYLEPAGGTVLRSASVPVSLDGAVRAGRLRTRDVAVLLAVGAGLSWAWAVVRW